jgi:protein-L-isoaspartate O-methyltransferase
MRRDFSHCKMEYKKDEQGKDVLLKDGKFQVMMEWEKPYMHACIDALQPFGDVLEVGFGLGYSADRIQSYHPKSHTIIEYHPEIAAHAREWAKRHRNVIIVEDSWQNALPKLGLFDCIFFDDYPLQSEQEMQKMQEESFHSELLLKKGEQVLKEVEKTLPFLSEIKYSDEDLTGLMKEIPLEQKRQVQQFIRFLKELDERGQISEKQLQNILNRLADEKKIAKEDIDIIMKKWEKKSSVASPNERLFTFLNQCLASHMRKNARFSCFLSSSVSKYQDEKFVDEIIANPALDYREEEIFIEVPANCAYFSGNKALVITITKRVN